MNPSGPIAVLILLLLSGLKGCAPRPGIESRSPEPAFQSPGFDRHLPDIARTEPREPPPPPPPPPPRVRRSASARPTARRVVIPRPPATAAARKVMKTLLRVKQRMRDTKYQHWISVNERKGKYFWDCSLMVTWVLRRAAPRARRALPRRRALAKDFYRIIARSPTHRPRRGWLRLSGPAQIRPGDLFAWLKPPFWRKRKNTGHVGFILGAPRPHPRHANVWLFRIADATRYLHEKDTRPGTGRGGFGLGTVAFLFGSNGTALAYGWYGSRQNPRTFVPTRIVFGRVVR